MCSLNPVPIPTCHSTHRQFAEPCKPEDISVHSVTSVRVPSPLGTHPILFSHLLLPDLARFVNALTLHDRLSQSRPLPRAACMSSNQGRTTPTDLDNGIVTFTLTGMDQRDHRHLLAICAEDSESCHGVP